MKFLESLSLRVELKEAISNIVVFNKDARIILPTGLEPAGSVAPRRPFLIPIQDFVVRNLTNEKILVSCLQSPSLSLAKAPLANRNDRVWERECQIGRKRVPFDR